MRVASQAGCWSVFLLGLGGCAEFDSLPEDSLRRTLAGSLTPAGAVAEEPAALSSTADARRRDRVPFSDFVPRFRPAAAPGGEPDGEGRPGRPGQGTEVPKREKRGYHLFNPTPRELMRELATDRPDKTESPVSVDAGHFQTESDLLIYTFDRRQPGGNGTDDHSFSWAFTNFKAGVLNNVDLQVFVAPFNYARSNDRASGDADRRFGFGDLVTRVKVNVWGNDGETPFDGTALADTPLGKSAFAIMPFLILPTGSRGLSQERIGGGVITPFAMDLPGDWSLGSQLQFDFSPNDRGGGYHANFSQTASLGHGITDRLAGYVEFWNNISTERGSRWEATVDFGLTYAVTADIQLDVGINIGVTRAADDFQPFLGLTTRF